MTTLKGRDTVRANLERFASAIGGEGVYPFTEEQILGNVAAMAAISLSVETGRTVQVGT